MKKIIGFIFFIINSSAIIARQPSYIIKIATIISLKTVHKNNPQFSLPEHQKLTGIIYQKTPITIENKTAHNKNNPQNKTITPQQARQAIEQNITTIFDVNDTCSLLDHLEQIKSYSKYLDPIENQKQIDAINFIAKNTNKSSLMDIPFWLAAWYETGILKGLPIPQNIRDTPYSEMLPKIISLSKKL